MTRLDNRHLFFSANSLGICTVAVPRSKNIEGLIKLSVRIHLYTALTDLPLILITFYSFTAKFKVIIITSCTELSVSAHHQSLKAVFYVYKDWCLVAKAPTATILWAQVSAFLHARHTVFVWWKNARFILYQLYDKQATCPRCNPTSFIQQRSGCDSKDRWDVYRIYHYDWVDGLKVLVWLVMMWLHMWNPPKWNIHTKCHKDQPEYLQDS